MTAFSILIGVRHWGDGLGQHGGRCHVDFTGEAHVGAAVIAGQSPRGDRQTVIGCLENAVGSRGHGPAFARFCIMPGSGAAARHRSHDAYHSQGVV